MIQVQLVLDRAGQFIRCWQFADRGRLVLIVGPFHFLKAMETYLLDFVEVNLIEFRFENVGALPSQHGM